MSVMPPVPCADSPALFDSTHPWDHRTARNVCATCPAVQDCLSRALAISAEKVHHAYRGPDGTWGGLLWKDGSIQVAPVIQSAVAA